MVAMRSEQRSPSATAAALRAFAKAEKEDWSQGVPIGELLTRVNRVADMFLPAGEGSDSRVSREFAPRSFRRYQTLGCINAPERVGKQVMYRFHHFVQALLVRKFLWEQVSAERIAALMAGRSTEETKAMLLEGVEMVARDGGGEGDPECGPDAVALWKCVRVSPGIELHMSCDLPKPKPGEVKRLLGKLEAALRRNL
jgi:DNA-binding transcriptional MerR regulator